MVTLGVAFMAGTLVLTDTIQKTFDDLFSDIYDDTDAVAWPKAPSTRPASNSAGGSTPRSTPSRGSTGWMTRSPTSVATRSSSTRTATPLAIRNGPPTLGGNWIDSEELNGFTISDGSPPRADDEVVIDKKSADDTGYQVGDTAQVLVKGGHRT